jgi:hypothetical protein
MEQSEDQMNLIMGIGPVIALSEDVKKTIRVGTIKQLKDVGDIHKTAGLFRIKYANQKEESEREIQIDRWVEILNLIFVEGFTREEFDNSIPELMAGAVDQFLFD